MRHLRASATTAGAQMNVRSSSMEATIRSHARRLDDGPQDYDALLDMVDDHAFVLLGEATHGTHEFYEMRAQITRRLIDERGFDAVAVEGDWPDAYRINRYVRGVGDASLDAAFGDFERFPTWMWCNRDVRDFVQWLHARNTALDASGRVGFYGLDLYSMYRSADAVIAYLEQVDPAQAAEARRLHACLDHVRDPQEYGIAAATGLRRPCREAAAKLLSELVRKAPDYGAGNGRGPDEQFCAERNASVVLDAEHYYRGMFGGRANSWNLRDKHMVDTLHALRRHLRAEGRRGRIVVWAHNSHLGDARATQMGQRGEWNIGQLLREDVGPDKVLLVGFTTYTGHVTAAHDWDRPPERRWVRPAHQDSYEHLLHATRLDRFFLPMQGEVVRALDGPLLERAIGVIYRPETELASHYFSAMLPAQFDAVFHLDETTAVEPLEVHEQWIRHEPPETWPSGL
jgi:erythromycin esterase-like protein